MHRRLFTIASAISLLLSVAAGGLWIQSYLTRDQIRQEAWKFRGRTPVAVLRTLTSDSGQVEFLQDIWDEPHALVPQAGSKTRWMSGSRWRFTIDPQHSGSFFYFRSQGRRTVVGTRWAALLFPLLILPAIWILRKRSSLHVMRLRNGLCAVCGYDLRSNASGACPECGTAVPA